MLIKVGDGIKKIIIIVLMVIQLFSLCSCYKDTLDTVDTLINIDSEIELKDNTYILNIHSKKIHKSSCGTAGLISPKNKQYYTDDITELYELGYTNCGNCFRN